MHNSILEKFAAENTREGFAVAKALYNSEKKMENLLLLEYNSAFLNLLGFSKDCLIEDDILSLFRSKINNDFNIIMGAQRFYSENQLKWYEIRINPVTDGLFGIVLLDASKEKALKDLTTSAIKLKKEERKLTRAQLIAQFGNWEIDFDKGIVIGSEEAFKIYGIDKIQGDKTILLVQQTVVAEDREKMVLAMKGLIENNDKYDMEFRIKKADTGEIRYLRSIAEKETENISRVVGVIIDITKAKQSESDLRNYNEELSSLYEQIAASEEELKHQLDEIYTHKELLQLSEERYKTIIDNSEDIIYSCDKNGAFTAVNIKFLEMYNLKESQVVGKKMVDILEKKERILEWDKNIQRVLNLGETVHIENTYNEDTVYSVTFSPIHDFKKNIIGVVGTNHDISVAKRHEKVIRKMAYYDDLTGLANRIYFNDKLKKIIKEARDISKIAVLFIDMDNFKKVNDTLGHALGDDFLKEAALRLKNCIDEKNCLARISGDEFAIILRDIKNISEMIPLLDSIISVFNKPFVIGNSYFDMTLSIGISIFPEDGDNIDELLSSADTAMYKAKEHGKNCYQFYNVRMKEELFRKLNIEVKLKRAINNDEFLVYYQPQFDAKKNIRGFEALIRWDSPQLGFLNPGDFIPVAEETGSITKIGEIVLNKACKFGSEINKKYDNKLITAVNISPLQISQQSFYDSVVRAIEVSGINPCCLELEVTENIFIDNFDFAISVLNELKALGIRIALDDFGTGFSSMSYLKKLPINLLKIDKSFIDEIKDSNPKNDLTEPIISLVHKLNIETIAEGVEEKVQMDYLLKVGCDNFQGFYLGKPLPEQQLEELLKKTYVFEK